jgi:hypothetical protein
VLGKVNDGVCPAESGRITREEVCKRAAAALGTSYEGSQNFPGVFSSSCVLEETTSTPIQLLDGYSSVSSKVFFNSHKELVGPLGPARRRQGGSKPSDRKLLCATGAPFPTRWPHPWWRHHVCTACGMHGPYVATKLCSMRCRQARPASVSARVVLCA